MRYVFPTWGAGEAERITGVKAITQRNWRRAGVLRRTGDGERREMFDVYGLAYLAAMGVLVTRGITPAAAQHAAMVAEPRIAALAISHDWEVREVSGINPGSDPGDARYVVVLGGGDPIEGAGEVLITESLAALEAQLDKREAYVPGMVILDIEALASQIVNRTGSPLCVIEGGQ